MFSTFFIHYVGVLRTLCFLLSLSITLVCCALFVFYFLYILRWCVAHYLFSTFFNNYVGLLRTICFLVSLALTLVCYALFVFLFFFYYYVGVLSLFVFYFLCLLRRCVAHYLFSSFLKYYVGVLRTILFLLFLTITLVCGALFGFYFL